MITTRPQLARQMKVRSNGISRMIAEGTLPEPAGETGVTPYWKDATLDAWFRHLQPQQSAYAPAKGIGTWEFKRFNAYICPVVQGTSDTAGWISSRRPSYLALSLDGYARVQVFKVLWAETQQGVRGEKIIRRKGDRNMHQAPWEDVYISREDTKSPLIYFQLDDSPLGEVKVEKAFRRGGTVATSDLLEAVEIGYATGFKNGKILP